MKKFWGSLKTGSAAVGLVLKTKAKQSYKKKRRVKDILGV